MRFLVTFLLLGLLGVSSAQTPNKKDTTATAHATGTFEIKLTPKPSDPPLGKFSFDKQFHGGLDGTSKGEMLTAGSGAAGSSGGYVALEQFTGTLDGRKGGFILEHSGTMIAGKPQLTITVVPDSGTGELKDLTGEMSITIANGKHSYDFAYTLPK
ncbi:MAG TPA: DUF3224 domain-containing protein [Candidatus Bathyarchaeia archaeon]|nr:DUF3224 domain-containing protein [Candidatus Bathyarchaeia archaeon]